MKIIIVGSSLFAIELAKKVKKRSTEVYLLIDNKEKALEISTDEEITVVHGDPTDVDILQELDLKTCDIFVAATEREEQSLITALYAKNQGVGNIYMETANKNITNILTTMGIASVNPFESAANNVALEILNPRVSELVRGEEGDFSILQKDVLEYKNLIGQHLGPLQGDFYNVIAVFKDHNYNFSANTVIEEDSILIILYKRGMLRDLEKALKKVK